MTVVVANCSYSVLLTGELHVSALSIGRAEVPISRDLVLTEYKPKSVHAHLHPIV
jgi:hypothetical protein